MDPVSTASQFGYRLKAQYNHLLPKVFGRPIDYIYTPYMLPDHDEMYQKAMKALDEMDAEKRCYSGCHNLSLK